ncbi:MAG: hypothetical protein JJT93_02605 [Gammaproteobacteria bacterium]|nr:hypothetical protein [Gammaproteobacteria bacterium]TVQ47402.1 MAG: hypothetical protein EA371_07830 [Gammaproteobacteria bacterium]
MAVPVLPRQPLGNVFLICLTLALSVLVAPRAAQAATAAEIEVSVDAALERFRNEVKGAESFLSSASGLLVFPRVIKAGFGIGGEYGEGALRVGGSTEAYYRTTGASIGFQLGAQSRTIIIAFMEDAALETFRTSRGWEVGVDGSVALINLGAGADLTTTNIRDPIVGFVFGNRGLMYNLTLEGTKVSRIER